MPQKFEEFFSKCAPLPVMRCLALNYWPTQCFIDI